MIQSKLLLEQQRYEKAAKEEVEIEKAQKKHIENEKKKSSLEKELDKHRGDYEKIKSTMLKDGVTKNNYEQSKGFKTMLDELDRKKDLEQIIFENKLKIKDLEVKIQHLISEKETQTLAIQQKGQNLSEDTKEEEDDHPHSLTATKKQIHALDVLIDTKGHESVKILTSNASIKVSNVN